MLETADATPGRGEAGRPADPAALFAALMPRERPPVERWNPAFCGDIDMRIARDGTWYYMGTPIRRTALVQLFAGILRREKDGRFYLVTPVEKVGIRVDDAPFVAVEMAVAGEGRGRRIAFRTNVDDAITADAQHPIRVVTAPATGEPAPYVRVRDGLEALIARAVFYDLVQLGEEAEVGGRPVFGVWSAGTFFELGRLDG